MSQIDRNLRHRSSIYDSMVKSPNRAMLRATGMTDDSFEKPIVGVISTWAENTPCNIHLHGFGQIAKEGVKDAGAWPVQFGTITVADGIAMGTPGMRFSLTSRDIIADSIEAAMGGHNVDAFVAIGGCDKNMPGSMIAIANMDIPAIFAYGGTIAPGNLNGKDIDLVSVFEGIGKWNHGDMTAEEVKELECNACPGPGGCGGMYTANTMATAIEVMGMSLPGSSSHPAESADKKADIEEAGRAVVKMLEMGLKPSDILTREAFEDAITVIMALGGSTNATLHLLAIAHAANVDLTLEDFNDFQERVPHLADLKPSGKYVFQDLYNVGGVPAVMKYLLKNGFLHGDRITCTGKTVAENLEAFDDLTPGQKVIMPLENPKRADGPLIILKGNLAPEGAVAKVSGVKVRNHTGPAKVFDSEYVEFPREYNHAFLGELSWRELIDTQTDFTEDNASILVKYCFSEWTTKRFKYKNLVCLSSEICQMLELTFDIDRLAYIFANEEVSASFICDDSTFFFLRKDIVDKLLKMKKSYLYIQMEEHRSIIGKLPPNIEEPEMCYNKRVSYNSYSGISTRKSIDE